MLLRALVLGGLLVVGAHCDLYSDFNFFNTPDTGFYRPWGWASPQYQSRSTLDAGEGKREPLSPDYKDPAASGSEQKPVLQAKAGNDDAAAATTTAKSPAEAVIPGGVIDVDAGGIGAGFPTISSAFGPDFDFTSSFGMSNSRPFGLGDIFGGFANQWWKGPNVSVLSNSRPFGLGDIFSGFANQWWKGPNVSVLSNSRPFGLGDIFSGFVNQWWKGKNVCIEREESTDDDEDDGEGDDEKRNATEKQERVLPDLFSTSIRLSNCFESANKYECVTKVNNHGIVKTFTVRYKCCYGYRREPGKGCVKQGDMKSLLDTLKDIDAREFRHLIKSTGMEQQFTDGNYSLFAPTDDALNDYNEKLAEMNNVDLARRRRALKYALSSKDLVLSHAVEGFIDIGDMINEQILGSENNNSTIRINIYPTQTQEKLITANCARIKKSNVLSNNGIIHTTEGIVAPATEDIETIIRNHPSLTNFRKAIENTDIPKHIKSDGHYTVFAPTDAAFSKLDEIQKQKILHGTGCADSILKFHFTAHTVCSSAILGNATTHNVEGDILNLERTAEDELFLEEKAKIIEADIMATNGVIHLIDEIIIPDAGTYIGNVLKNQNFTKFQEIMEKAGLKDEINALGNATVFVPVDKAFETPEAKQMLEDAERDPQLLKDIVRYHVVQGMLQSNDMNNNMKLETNGNGKQLRINLYSTLPLFTNVVNRATANCARIIGFDEKACGSVIHQVNKVLVPPTQSIFEMIHSNAKYSTLRSILSGTEVEKILQENNRSLTFLAPTDETFAALDEKDKKVLLENKEKANIVLKNHVLTEVLCCAGVGPQSWGFSSYVSTLGNNNVEVGRSGSQIRINRGVVTSCDNVATNGVLHTINRVLLPRQPQVPTIGGGFILFDI